MREREGGGEGGAGEKELTAEKPDDGLSAEGVNLEIDETKSSEEGVNTKTIEVPEISVSTETLTPNDESNVSKGEGRGEREREEQGRNEKGGREEEFGDLQVAVEIQQDADLPLSEAFTAVKGLMEVSGLELL